MLKTVIIIWFILNFISCIYQFVRKDKSFDLTPFIENSLLYFVLNKL